MRSNIALGGLGSVGPFERFSDAWLACLRVVMRAGADIADNGAGLREVLNLSVMGGPCTLGDYTALGASSERIALMLEKYGSLDVVPPYTMSYGSLFRAHEGVDQVAWMVSRLREKAETKSATIGFHVPGRSQVSCVSLLDGKVRDGLLYINVVYRSQNVFASQPGNAIALFRIQREIAERVGVSVGPMVLHILSAHIYHSDFGQVERILSQNDVPQGASQLPG